MKAIFGEDSTVIIRNGKKDKTVEKQELADFLTGRAAKNIPTLEKTVILIELMETTVIKINVEKSTMQMIPSGNKFQVSSELMEYVVNM